MKKTLSVLIAFVLMFTLIGSVSAATSNVPTFKVDGKLFVTPKGEPQPYINKDNRTMGSLRLIATALGVESKNIKWDNTKQTATLTRGNNTVSVTVGKKVITVNGKNVTMDTLAEMKKGRVFIPARFIAQGLGVKISFDGSTNTVNFITGTNEVVTNNFADYGLKTVETFPLTIASNGLSVTYHEVFLYKTDSAEAKALHEKYDFFMFHEANHILWAKVTIENKGSKAIAYDYSDLEQKIRGSNAMAVSLTSTFAQKNKDNYIHTWRLEPKESITGYVALLKENSDPIKFISLNTVHKDVSNSIRIAVKE